MKAIAALLLGLIAAVHYGADLVAFGYDDFDLARRSWYYVFRSAEGAVQYAVIAGVVIGRALPVHLDREGMRRWLRTAGAPCAVLAFICGWGSAEHIQAGACRLLFDMGTQTPTTDPMAGVCDMVSGAPLYVLGLGIVSFLAASVAANIRGNPNG